MKRRIGCLFLMMMPVFVVADGPPPASAAQANTPAPNQVVTPAATYVNPARAPKIRFTSLKWNFGKVEEGPEIKHLFRFRNLGKTSLKIERVQPSCGCTGAEAEGRNEIPPGETGAIRVSYNTNGRPGHTSKTVTVVTNDPANQSVVLTFEVDVVRDIDIQPNQAYFYGVKKGETRTQQVKILGKEGMPLSILSAKSVNGTVSVTLTALVEPATQPVQPGAPKAANPLATKRFGATLDVVLPADKPIGSINDEIVCATSSKKKPEIRIPVNGEVIGRVQLFPKQVYLSGSSGQSTMVQVAVDPPGGFSVRRVKMAKGQVKPWVKKTRQPDGKTQYQIELTIPKSLPEGPIDDEMTVYSNDTEQPEIKVPVKGTKTAPPPKT